MTQESEVVAQEAPQQESQNQSQTQAAEQLQQEAPKPDQDHNWKQVRQVLQQQKQEIEELRNRLSRPPEPVEVDEFANLDPEDVVTVDKARKMAEKYAEKYADKTARKYVQEYAQQQQIVQDEQRARSKYEDYDYVIENFAVPLLKNDPALAHKIQNSKNPAETAYKLGKLSDEYEDQTEKKPMSAKAERVIKNSSRPVSSNAITSSLKDQASDYSKMSKEDIWKMSEKYARGV